MGTCVKDTWKYDKLLPHSNCCALTVTTGDEQRCTITAFITLWQKTGEYL